MHHSRNLVALISIVWVVKMHERSIYNNYIREPDKIAISERLFLRSGLFQELLVDN